MEVIHGPFIGEKNDVLTADIGGDFDIGSQI